MTPEIYAYTAIGATALAAVTIHPVDRDIDYAIKTVLLGAAWPFALALVVGAVVRDSIDWLLK